MRPRRSNRGATHTQSDREREHCVEGSWLASREEASPSAHCSKASAASVSGTQGAPPGCAFRADIEGASMHTTRSAGSAAGAAGSSPTAVWKTPPARRPAALSRRGLPPNMAQDGAWHAELGLLAGESDGSPRDVQLRKPWWRRATVSLMATTVVAAVVVVRQLASSGVPADAAAAQSLVASGSCAAAGEQCSETQGCCDSSMQCYAKNDYWANCRTRRSPRRCARPHAPPSQHLGTTQERQHLSAPGVLQAASDIYM